MFSLLSLSKNRKNVLISVEESIQCWFLGGLLHWQLQVELWGPKAKGHKRPGVLWPGNWTFTDMAGVEGSRLSVLRLWGDKSPGGRLFGHPLFEGPPQQHQLELFSYLPIAPGQFN